MNLISRSTSERRPLLVLLLFFTFVLASYQHEITQTHANESLFIHPGKAGGGTVKKIIRQAGLPFQWCHPNPTCLSVLQEQYFDNVLVVIRDPVDRFVSAFNWRSKILCFDINETRAHHGQSTGSAVRDPTHFCKNSSQMEAHLLHDVYNSNPNIMAEALCYSEEARMDLQRIGHAKHPLTAWLPPTLLSITTNNNETDLIAVVQEPGFNLVQQVEAAVQYIVNKNISWTNMTLNMTKSSPSTHSSGRNTTSSLSPLGTCCAAHYFQQDYQLLQRLLQTSICKFGACRDAISSILKRRAKFLHNNISCEQQFGSLHHENSSLRQKVNASSMKQKFNDSSIDYKHTKKKLSFSRRRWQQQQDDGVASVIVPLLEIATVLALLIIYGNRLCTRYSNE